MNERSVEVESPESVRLRFPLAALPARILAFGVDAGILALAIVLLLVLAGVSSHLTGFHEPFAILLIGLFFVRHFYFFTFEVLWHGATPGKRLLGLRVISRDGGGLTVDAIATRNLVRDVELFVPLMMIAAPESIFGGAPSWIWMPAALWTLVISLLPVLTHERTRAGDLVGGTVVVRLPRAALIADEAARTSFAPPSRSITFTNAQLSVYGERELEVLANLIRKIDRGNAALEDQIVVARTIAQKIDYAGAEPTEEPTRFLTTFYKRQRAALEKRLLFGKRKESKHDTNA